MQKILNNQALGLFPLLVAMFLDIFYSYKIAFTAGISLCFIGFLTLFLLRKEHYNLFLLIPTTLTLILYSFFFFFDLKSFLNDYSPLVAEILLVVLLAFIGFSKRGLITGVKKSSLPMHTRNQTRHTLNEAYFIAQVIQNLYTLHLFVILMYIHLPESSPQADALLYTYLGVIILALVIIYGQIRTHMMNRNLKKEVWLPVLGEKGQVIGSMARSVSRSSSKKYYHPIVRVAVIYNGMLYLTRRDKSEYVSPELLDYPLYKYVLFHHNIESTLQETLGELSKDSSITPRLMIRYTFENDNAKHLVSLYTIRLQSEEQLRQFADGKLWTPKQIQDNISAGVFSEYFEKEFPYLQNTILLAESVCNNNGEVK
ncbi:hypothetical protein [Parabacteroides sp. PH5-17]|nr:hypothetical protein [Parabacteroides sp. PH5-17]